MNEAAARKVVLTRALENADIGLQLLSENDRLYASKSAHELAQWEAADRKTALTPALFLEKRAEQILKKIAERTPTFAAVIKPRGIVGALGAALPTLAFLIGALVDRIGDTHRVDLLSAPLLMIIGWNLAVYLLLLFWWIAPGSSKQRAGTGLLTKWAEAGTTKARKLPSKQSETGSNTQGGVWALGRADPSSYVILEDKNTDGSNQWGAGPLLE